MNTYQLGDYVIVSHPTPDTEDCGYGPTWEREGEPETWIIVEFKTNLLGSALVRVVNAKSKTTTSFYPRELSWEDGSRPS